MDLLLILTYTAICVAIFKLFRIPLNKWTVPTAILGGIILIGSLIVVMNYNHPYSEMSRRYFVTTPIISSVSGRVINVPVNSNSLIKKGDILFQIDPVLLKNRLMALQAQVKMAKDDLNRANFLVSKNTFSIRDRDALQATVDQLKAEEANALYDLDQTTVRAPTEGYVVQIALRPGMMAAALPIRPLMIFVPDEDHYYVGWFRQNSLLRLKVGAKAEVIFDGIPGQIFSGKIKSILPVMAEGQVSPSGELIGVDQLAKPGRIPVILEITDPRFSEYKKILPGGASGQVAIYSEHFHHVAIMRKILLRMASWMNYLFPFH